MAGGVGIFSGSGKGYPGKLTMFVLFTSIVAATGRLIFDYDIEISGGVKSTDSFLKNFLHGVCRKRRDCKNLYCQLDTQLLIDYALWLCIGNLISHFFAPGITRVYGHKISKLIGGFSYLTGCVLNGAAIDMEMLIIGHIMLGLGFGCLAAVPVYLSETALTTNLINDGTSKIEGRWRWGVSMALAAVPVAINYVNCIVLVC